MCLIAVLLFAQLATAAYACPREVVRDGEPVVLAMPDCDAHQMHTDPGQPQLCKAHCDQGNQTTGSLASPDLSSAPVLLTVLDWKASMLALALAPRRALLAASGAPPPGTPPLYLSLLVLRN